MKTLKAVMPRSEELKKLLKAQYEAEYEDYQQMVEIEMQRQAQVAEEQRKWKLQQEGNYGVKLLRQKDLPKHLQNYDKRLDMKQHRSLHIKVQVF